MSNLTKITVVLTALCMLAAVQAKAVDEQGRFVLVIDPGHGGKDPGAINGKNQEKTINLNIALKMGKLIEDNCKDVKVIYTRKTDVFVELYKRADIANKAGADMFISIHTNSAKNKSAYGAETYLLGVEENRTTANLNAALEENKAILLENDYEMHYEGYDPNSPESMIIFEFMQNEYQKESLKFAGMVQKQMVSQARRSDRGVHQAGFLVLWKTAMPSILVELGFISNSDDCRYMTSQKGVEELATSLYKAFVSYLEDYRKQTAKSVNLTQTASGSSKTTEQDTRQASSGTTSSPVFKIQFLLSKEELKSSDNRIRNLPDVEYYKEGGQYKYTCGNTSDYNEITRLQAEVRKRYKDAFVIAFLNGSKITVREAREIIDRNGR